MLENINTLNLIELKQTLVLTNAGIDKLNLENFVLLSKESGMVI